MRDLVFLALLVVMVASSIGWLVQASRLLGHFRGEGFSRVDGALRWGDPNVQARFVKALFSADWRAHFSVEHDEIVFARAMLVTGIVSQAGFVAMLLFAPA